MKIQRVRPTDKCQYDGCDAVARDLVYNRTSNKVQKYCAAHADVVMDYGCPEYFDNSCNNCGCRQGVN